MKYEVWFVPNQLAKDWFPWLKEERVCDAFPTIEAAQYEADVLEGERGTTYGVYVVREVGGG